MVAGAEKLRRLFSPQAPRKSRGRQKNIVVFSILQPSHRKSM